MAQMKHLRNLTGSFQAHLRCSQRLFASTPFINSDDNRIIKPQQPLTKEFKPDGKETSFKHILENVSYIKRALFYNFEII